MSSETITDTEHVLRILIKSDFTCRQDTAHRIPSIFNANLRGGFCHKIDELSVILHQNQVTYYITHSPVA